MQSTPIDYGRRHSLISQKSAESFIFDSDHKQPEKRLSGIHAADLFDDMISTSESDDSIEGKFTINTDEEDRRI